MKRFLLPAFLLISSSALAQSPQPVSTVLIPVSPSQHNLAITTATSLTIAPGATYAVVCAKGGVANVETDGSTTVTGSVGMSLGSGSCMSLNGGKVLQNFSAIQQTGSTTTLDVLYYKF